MPPKIKFEDIQGEWAIISDEEILVHDSDLSIILEKAEGYDENKVTIRKILGGRSCFSLNHDPPNILAHRHSLPSGPTGT